MPETTDMLSMAREPLLGDKMSSHLDILQADVLLSARCDKRKHVSAAKDANLVVGYMGAARGNGFTQQHHRFISIAPVWFNSGAHAAGQHVVTHAAETCAWVPQYQ